MDLEVGLKGSQSLVVTEKDLASFAGNAGVDVLSTHRVVLLMEMSARDAIAGRMPDGQIPLGTRIEIKHLAAAPLGAEVRAEARLAAVDGRRLLFHVAAFDRFETLAEGENELVVVSLERFKKRVGQKVEKGGT